eukprot:CAMPEP_0170166544 /NCGR_PEP_ID=MMETSP0040_2-20121228/195_1 /TAXON_ID=641309 /ORGANISM="Lotharella oceanica, Strain CCMP622" /LENGTH=65 /DNA_ID=CAMNT_0010404291 /DNA_START=642 /DNA_END=835 /DNA_ORIENTATION=-
MARDAGIVTGIVITAQDEKNIPNTAGSDHLEWAVFAEDATLARWIEERRRWSTMSFADEVWVSNV